jgi:serine/threonine-protein kinase
LESYLNILGFRCAYGAASEPTDAAEPEVESTEIPEELGVGSTMVSEKDSMVMVYVPAGEFQMGSEDGEDDEKPVHTVYLDAFWIDQTEVTNAMYAKCIDARACDPPDSLKSYSRDSYYGNLAFDNYPVIYVSWNDAKAYCEWADRRLPTEAEWEKAASWDDKTQTHRVYPWGNEFDCQKGNFDDETLMDKEVVPGGENCDGFTQTAPVGSFSSGASYYDVFDMAGNNREWVSSLYQSYPYNATDGREDMSSTEAEARVLRGGAWDNTDIRSTFRFWHGPENSGFNVGFRCACDTSP